jgi:GH35 family endo-1,4-beta-xylanase
LCFPTDNRKLPPDLHGAHLVGNDNVPIRADIRWEDKAIRCTPRMQDPVGLSLLWPVKGFGTIQLQTTRLPGREQPYNLHLELARHQLMRVTVKREEWGLFDYSGMDEIAARIDRSRDAFVRALQEADRPAVAAKHADESLLHGLWAGEEMARFHAGIFLNRRQQTGGFSRPFLGVKIPEGPATAAALRPAAEAFDFAYIPFVWRNIQPTEQAPAYDAIEASVKVCAAAKLALRGGPLLSFGVSSVPDWMYIWENDFESIYEAAREHVERTVQRFSKQVASWVVASGVQADNVFGFSFEQTMELTRMAATVAKQVAPRAQVLIDLSQPWGEYYARNQQTVPPLLYADMAVQSGINFDGFGLQFVFGLASDGYHVRDPFQVSALIDRLANLGKPLHITALGAPSRTAPEAGNSSPGGQWHAPWSDEVQADWLAAMWEIALSKPYVETVCVQTLVDRADDIIPNGGLLREDLTPKPALARLIELRKRLLAGPDK